jgi:hypothetical protein
MNTSTLTYSGMKQSVLFLAGCLGIGLSTYLSSWLVYKHFTITSVGRCTITSKEITIRTWRGPVYRPIVRYDYVVDGVKYSGRTLGLFALGDEFGSIYSTESWADEVLSRYTVGQESVFYYNPRDPSICVLDRSVNLGSVFICAATLLLGVLMVLGCAGEDRITRRFTKCMEYDSSGGSAPCLHA